MNRTPTLYFFHMPDCPACKKAKPGLVGLEKEFPGLKVAPLDITETELKPIGSNRYEITATPTYLLEHAGRRFAVEGFMQPQLLRAWLRAKFGGGQ